MDLPPFVSDESAKTKTTLMDFIKDVHEPNPVLSETLEQGMVIGQQCYIFEPLAPCGHQGCFSLTRSGL